MMAEVRLCRDDGTVLRIDRLLDVLPSGGGIRFGNPEGIIEDHLECVGYHLVLCTRKATARGQRTDR